MKILENVSLAQYTTFGVGGPARYLVEVKTKEEMREAVGLKEEWVVIAGGSNLLVSDVWYGGLVIVNRITGMQELRIGSGVVLNDLVDWANEQGWAGLESLAGIPGTVGGAVYGNAGAYGQAISDHLAGVTTLSGYWPKEKCGFGYRESIFKKNKEIILGVEFELEPGDPGELAYKSAEIRAKREKKYPVGLKCPGSFFKNLVAKELPERVLNMIPVEKIIEGKVPAGYLLEEIGAKGRRKGGAKVADYHGNLLINEGGARASDVWDLAHILQDEVREKFGVVLEPEVQVLGGL